VEVVAVDDQVAVEGGRANALVRVHLQRPEGDRQVMVEDKFLALEDQFRHARPPRMEKA
jgi:hypothetical protein